MIEAENRSLIRFAGLCCGLLLGFVSSPLVAQASEPSPGAIREGWHTVRPGETLGSIAEKYLGSTDAWQRIAAINPEIKDPDVIEPNQRIRIRVEGGVSSFVAQIAELSRRVEQQLRPLPWADAAEENLLVARDGIRTFEDSSAEILFQDETRLRLNEESLVFLGERKQAEPRREADEIEVVVGQADLESAPSERAEELRVLLGGSRVTPRAPEGAEGRARVRRPTDGGAQVMVFEGEGEVESGGARQQVDKGMGTTVREGEPPAPPEQLLPAATPLRPERGSEWEIANPSISWEPVVGAQSYTVEVCRDSDCARLVAREVGLEDTSWRPDELPAGSLFWRVTPVSPSGLDGYPSESLPFTILRSATDRQPPKLEVRFEGPRTEARGAQVLGGEATLSITAEDEGSGIARIVGIVDGAETSVATAKGPWSPGEHTVQIVAIDRAGHEARSPLLKFFVDVDPPLVTLGQEAASAYRSVRGLLDPTPGTRGRDRSRRRLPPLVWASTGGDWQPLEPLTRLSLAADEASRLELRTLRRKSRVYFGSAANLQIRKRRGIWIEVSDERAGIEEAELWLTRDSEDPRKRQRLVIEARDRVGNRSLIELPRWRGWGGNPR